MNYYPHHLGDYAKDTAHLTLLQHGAYRLLLDHAYSTERPLPVDNRKALYMICRAMTRHERSAVDFVITKFFPNGVNKRVAQELAHAQDKSLKAQAAARKSVELRTSVRSADAQPVLNARSADGQLTNNQEPIANNQTGGFDVGALSTALEKPVDKKLVQNPQWLFNIDHARLQARKLGIDPAGKTHQELKDAIIAMSSLREPQPKFA